MTQTDQVFQHASGIAAAAVDAGRIPGAALGLIGADGTRRVSICGLAAREPQPVPLTADTLFDLASLTKVIVTTTAVLRLAEAGRLDLDDALSRHLPDLYQYRSDHPLRRLTVRQCLSHTTGLPAVEPIYTWGHDPERLKALVLQRDWPLGQPVYSDIDFILLGLLVERLTGQPLTAQIPPGDFAATPGPDRAAATERCSWRGRVIRGEVHDENAFALGGFAGHAGLFGTVDAVLDFAHALLDRQCLSPAALAEMRRPASTGPFGLGWQIKFDGWSGGCLCSPQTIGHTGFTGTGLWIDWQRGYAWCLLTNRVHPSRHIETGIMDLRRSIGNALAAGWQG